MDDSSDETNKIEYTFPGPARSIKKGDCILIDDEPCKVKRITRKMIAKGSFMIDIAAVDLFEDNYVEHSVFESQTVDFVNVEKKKYNLIKLDEKGNATIKMYYRGGYVFSDSLVYLDDLDPFHPYIILPEHISMNPDTGFFKQVLVAFNNGNYITVKIEKAMRKEKVMTVIHKEKFK